MTLLEWLIISHLTADFLLQTEYEAVNKMKGRFFNLALVKHCAIYALCFTPIVWWFSMSGWWLVLLFGSHMFLDRRWPVVWWITAIKQTRKETLEKHVPWLVIVVDQIFHLLILAVIATAN